VGPSRFLRCKKGQLGNEECGTRCKKVLKNILASCKETQPIIWDQTVFSLAENRRGQIINEERTAWGDLRELKQEGKETERAEDQADQRGLEDHD